MRIPLICAPLMTAALASCGSEAVRDLPPPAKPPSSPALSAAPAGRVVPIGHGAVPASRPAQALRDPARLAVVDARARRLNIYDMRTHALVASAPAGVGPTHVACLPHGPCLVADTQGNALLRFVLRPHLELVRSQYLPGGPYGMALDAARNRLWITLPGKNELVELPARAHPHVLRRFPTVRQPNGVAVDERTGRVLVTGRAPDRLEWIDPDR